MTREEKLKKKVGAFPEEPGVYLMKNAASEVIYVGKAKSLRARVTSYFSSSGGWERLIEQKFDQVEDIDFVVTNTEKEAFILELNFIKQFKPRYNVIFRDDKRFVSIAINMKEDWPRPSITRKVGRKNTLYFGPYKSSRDADLVLRSIQKVFPLRRCSLRECRKRTRPCIYAEMGKCVGPCVGNVTEAEYGELLDEVILFLKGRTGELIEKLEGQMRAAVKDQRFEAAAQIRDRLAVIRKTMERQYVGSSEAQPNRDVFGMRVLDRVVYLSLLALRNGNIQDIGHFRFPAHVDRLSEALASYITQFYHTQSFIPDEVILPMELPDGELLAEVLSERLGRKVLVIHPQRGDRRRLLELASENCQKSLEITLSDEEATRRSLDAIQEFLGLAQPPRRIECFDISTLGGTLSVGAMTCYVDAKPARDQYRHYKIKTVAGQDDFAMMHEVLSRRFKQGREDEHLPDLIVIDGGKGQLGVARAVLRELDLPTVPVVALAKERTRGGEKVRHERVFVPDADLPRTLDPSTSAFQVLTGIRDEAHRFAITYHRKLRSRPLRQNALDNIRGIGPALQKALMQRFGNIQAVREASVKALMSVAGLGRAKAEAIRKHFREEGAGGEDTARLREGGGVE